MQDINLSSLLFFRAVKLIKGYEIGVRNWRRIGRNWWRIDKLVELTKIDGIKLTRNWQKWMDLTEIDVTGIRPLQCELSPFSMCIWCLHEHKRWNILCEVSWALLLHHHHRSFVLLLLLFFLLLLSSSSSFPSPPHPLYLSLPSPPLCPSSASPFSSSPFPLYLSPPPPLWNSRRLGPGLARLGLFKALTFHNPCLC